MNAPPRWLSKQRFLGCLVLREVELTEMALSAGILDHDIDAGKILFVSAGVEKVMVS